VEASAMSSHDYAAVLESGAYHHHHAGLVS